MAMVLSKILFVSAKLTGATTGVTVARSSRVSSVTRGVLTSSTVGRACECCVLWWALYDLVLMELVELMDLILTPLMDVIILIGLLI